MNLRLNTLAKMVDPGSRVADIYVKKGQKVKLGQKIGKLTGSHIHLGVTKTDKDYIDKKHDNTPCKYYWKDNGTWLNPMKIIEDNLRAAGKDPVQ